MKIINKLEEWIGGSLFILIFFILLAQILARQVFDSPLNWSEELARLLFVYVGMLGISVGIRNQQHVFIDFLTNWLPEKVKKTHQYLRPIIDFYLSDFVYPLWD